MKRGGRVRAAGWIMAGLLLSWMRLPAWAAFAPGPKPEYRNQRDGLEYTRRRASSLLHHYGYGGELGGRVQATLEVRLHLRRPRHASKRWTGNGPGIRRGAGQGRKIRASSPLPTKPAPARMETRRPRRMRPAALLSTFRTAGRGG